MQQSKSEPQMKNTWPQPVRTMLLAAVLAVVALCALFVMVTSHSSTASADSGGTNTTPLGATQISGDLPSPEANWSGFIQWGGGTLLQFTARMAVNGCDVSRLWVWDRGTRSYTGYFFDEPTFQNTSFTRKYPYRIPASTIWTVCAPMIDRIYGYPSLTESERSSASAMKKGAQYPVSNLFDPLVNECGDHWNSLVKSQILSFLPVEQRLCAVPFERQGLSGGLLPAGASYYQFGIDLHGDRNSSNGEVNRFAVHTQQPAIGLNRDPDRPVNDHVASELHELCHANQVWHITKTAFANDNLPKLFPDDLSIPYLSHTPYMKRFIATVGFRRTSSGEWTLPKDSPFAKGIYGEDNPVELAAELCSMYAMQTLGIHGTFKTDAYIKRHLTDDVVRWLEDYIFVLPESRIRDGSLIAQPDSDTVYVTKIVDGKRFKRLIPASARASYGHLKQAPVLRVPADVLGSFAESTLVRPADRIDVYHAGVGPRQLTKHYISHDVFVGGRLNDESVFVINADEFNLYTRGRDIVLSDIRQ